MRRPCLVILGLMVVAAVAAYWVGMGVTRGVADRARDPSISASQAAIAERDAYVAWDAPPIRLLHVAHSATRLEQAGACPVMEVTFYAVFGIVLGRVSVDCQGSATGLP